MKAITWCNTKLNACDDGAEWFLAQKDHSLVAIVKAAIAGGKATMGYANWGIVRIMSHKQRVLYACYAARQVLKNFEDRHPEDKRPRLAIEAAEKWADNMTEANRSAADSAARAADSAAYGAYRAARAADSAAESAAYGAYSAAYSAADSAAYGAASAAHSAASAAGKLRAKILRYGVKLIMEEKK